MPNDFNQHVIDEFRANRGLPGPFEGGRILLLTTTGARSGTAHTTPVGFLPDGGERVLVIASAAWSAQQSGLVPQSRGHPRVTVEDGVFTYVAEAEVLAGAERDAAFARAVERDPGWAEYQAKTSRVIPVVALRAIESGPPNVTGATTWGDGLKAVHDGIRRELGLIRREIAESGPGLGAQLRVNCLTLCKGLHNHHAGEDAALFPFIGSRHPELGAVLELMREEHERIAALLARLQETVSTNGADPGLVLPEVERLTDELERHLLHEEEQLIPLLDAAAM